MSGLALPRSWPPGALLCVLVEPAGAAPFLVWNFEPMLPASASQLEHLRYCQRQIDTSDRLQIPVDPWYRAQVRLGLRLLDGSSVFTSEQHEQLMRAELAHLDWVNENIAGDDDALAEFGFAIIREAPRTASGSTQGSPK